MRNNIRRLICIAGILALAIPLLLPYNALADDAESEDSVVKPNVVIQTKDWLVVTYGEKVADKFVTAQQLDTFVLTEVYKIGTLNESTDIREPVFYTDGAGYMQDVENVYFLGQLAYGWIMTGGSWNGGSASFWGNSSSAWYGDYPSSNCDEINLCHQIGVEQFIAYIQSTPSGWTNYYLGCFSPLLQEFATWYLGTGWSNLAVSYEHPTFIAQSSPTYFCFDGFGGPVTNCSLYLDYGD